MVGSDAGVLCGAEFANRLNLKLVSVGERQTGTSFSKIWNSVLRRTGIQKWAGFKLTLFADYASGSFEEVNPAGDVSQ